MRAQKEWLEWLKGKSTWLMGEDPMRYQATVQRIMRVRVPPPAFSWIQELKALEVRNLEIGDLLDEVARDKEQFKMLLRDMGFVEISKGHWSKP